VLGLGLGLGVNFETVWCIAMYVCTNVDDV
jgi:hypothetical protein